MPHKEKCVTVTHLLIIVTVFALSACSSPSKKHQSKQIPQQDGAPTQRVDIASIPNATPKKEPRSKYGNPKSYEVFGKRYYVMKSSKGFVQRGIASWYGTKFHGKRTSSGEPYDMFAMTAAHKTLPLPTYVEVTNLDNKRKVIVKVNDRGPFVAGRIIDLSHTAARKLGIIGSGTGKVEIRAIDPNRYGKTKKQNNKARKKTSAQLAQERLFVQVGAFSSSDNAERLQKDLYSRLGPRLRIDTYFSEVEKLYRVRIGPIATVDDAERVHTRLNNIGFTNSRIVVDSFANKP